MFCIPLANEWHFGGEKEVLREGVAGGRSGKDKIPARILSP